MWLKKIFSNFVSRNLGIDLGTSTTLVYVEGKGVELIEPSVVAIDAETKKTIAVGKEAKEMLGKTPEKIKAIRPMKDGVIANFEVTEELLKYVIRKVQGKSLFAKPKVVVAVPSGITDVEMRAVRDSVEHAGASEVWLIPEPMAAAIGVGLPIESPKGNMIIDIGGGTTEIAVIALSGIVCNTSIRIAGDEMNESIMNYVKQHYNLLIGETSAEEIKINIGSAIPPEGRNETYMEIKGRDFIGGLPKTIKITSKEVREALKHPIAEIITAVKQSLEKTPPELSSDIIEQGIVLTGGGALLQGLAELISIETGGLKVTRAEDPIKCVANGTGKVLEKFEKYKDILTKGV